MTFLKIHLHELTAANRHLSLGSTVESDQYVTHFTPYKVCCLEQFYNSLDLMLGGKKTLTSQRRVTSEVSDENVWTVGVEIQDSASAAHGKKHLRVPITANADPRSTSS